MSHQTAVPLATILAVVLSLGCRAGAEPNGSETDEPDLNLSAIPTEQSEPTHESGPRYPEVGRYPWLAPDEVEGTVRLRHRHSPPEGYERIDVAEDSWADFLRDLPVFPLRTTVYSHDMEVIEGAPAADVASLDVGERNLQQCADAILRLRAEYLWSRDRRDEIAFHFTSGDRVAWSDWRRGERYLIDGSSVDRVQSGPVDDSRANFRDYLRTIFTYAGTRSLRHDSRPADGPLQIGDLFVDPGSPGHAVLILDIAVDEAGDRLALLGQSFMPAQEFHVLESAGPRVVDGVWFRLPDADHPRIDTPSWPAFHRADARRF
jgi:hypothetical protein